MHSRRALAIHRSQIAFARGAWTGVAMIRMPAAVKTASNNLALSLPKRLRTSLAVIVRAAKPMEERPGSRSRAPATQPRTSRLLS